MPGGLRLKAALIDPQKSAVAAKKAIFPPATRDKPDYLLQVAS
jgi:hypothetical protein